MGAVTIDLWHTLMFLPPEQEEAYMAHQIAIGTDVLRAAQRLPGAPERTEAELRKAFERAYVGAVDASSEGRTVTPAEQISRAAMECARLVDPDSYLERLAAEVRSTDFRRAPGALELLDGLRRDGYRIGLISNTVGEPGNLFRPVLAAMGLDRYLDTMVFSDEQPWTKPDPRIFELALGRLGSRPNEAVHVGDGWSDLEGARRAGYRASVLFTGLHSYGARYKELFFPKLPDDPPASYRTDQLSEVGPFVRKILPPG